MTTPTTPLEPLVSDERIAAAKKTNFGVYRFNTSDANGATIYASGFEGGMQVCRNIYEAERSKEREVMREKDERIAELEAEAGNLRALADGPTARRQFPDGSVPRNSEDAAKGWMEHYYALLSKLNERINTPEPDPNVMTDALSMGDALQKLNKLTIKGTPHGHLPTDL